MQAAEEWGTPPWIVEQGPALWILRYNEYIKAREIALKRGTNAHD